LAYFLHTLILFTYDQLFDVVLPFTIFGVCSAYSGSTLNLPNFPLRSIYCRVGLVFIWLWMMCLQVTISNQRHPSSIAEDSINKPWRPMPSGRLGIEQACQLLLGVLLLNGLVAHWLGVLDIWMLFTFLMTVYNDWGGSDNSFTRTLLNAAAFAIFSCSALQVALLDHPMTRECWEWVTAITLVILTTIHAQDFRDEIGDRARGRSTLVTIFGHSVARASLILMVFIWSFGLPLRFGVGWKAAVVIHLLGLHVAYLTVLAGTMRENRVPVDKRMYRMWALWVASLGPLPLL
ncbi:hypothetical protein BDV96DRAFT_465220, partial [Lophiotrema nucula]